MQTQEAGAKHQVLILGMCRGGKTDPELDLGKLKPKLELLEQNGEETIPIQNDGDSPL